MSSIILSEFVSSLAASALARHADAQPWDLTHNAEQIVQNLLPLLPGADYVITNGIAVHRTAIVEPGATLKGPLILGPNCLVAAGAYLRGGCWLEAACTVGPGSELKSSFVFAGSKLAHFNFVGDSVLGHGVNLEAGSVIANYRNEREIKGIQVRVDGALRPTGVDKFGALVGDHTCVGANAVLAPGTLLAPGSVVQRLQRVDQEQDTG